MIHRRERDQTSLNRRGKEKAHRLVDCDKHAHYMAYFFGWNVFNLNSLNTPWNVNWIYVNLFNCLLLYVKLSSHLFWMFAFKSCISSCICYKSNILFVLFCFVSIMTDWMCTAESRFDSEQLVAIVKFFFSVKGFNIKGESAR